MQSRHPDVPTSRDPMIGPVSPPDNVAGESHALGVPDFAAEGAIRIDVGVAKVIGKSDEIQAGGIPEVGAGNRQRY